MAPMFNANRMLSVCQKPEVPKSLVVELRVVSSFMVVWWRIVGEALHVPLGDNGTRAKNVRS